MALQIVGGTDTGDKPFFANAGTTGGLFQSSVVDGNGNPIWIQPVVAPSISDDGGGGGSMKVTLPDLRWNVALLNGAALLFVSGMLFTFFFLLSRVDDRFDKSSEKIDRITEQVSDVKSAVAVQSADLKAILEKVNAPKSAESAGAKSVK